MTTRKKYPLSRRNFLKVSAATTAGVSMLPLGGCNLENVPAPMKRTFGKLGFDVTTIGLGGQASLQRTAEHIDPVSIILKAFKLGINYYDTSNVYGDSQLHYGEAFKKLNLIPGKEDYKQELRESIWLTSKTALRWGNPGWPEIDDVANWGKSEDVQCAADDVRRSLSQMFGDNKGNYPEGAYLDMVLIHSIHNIKEVDILYKGIETPLNTDENFGALVALRDLRDGTNHTGMNPKNEILIRHIGLSGHVNAEAMMDMIQRDEYDLLEGMLVAINANDKTKFNMQHNVIPVAEAKGMGVIAMKVFADAAMFHREPVWPSSPEDTYYKVGSPELPSRPLIEYAITTPGVHTAILGIGHIDDDPMKCQLVQNYYAAQIEPLGLTQNEREKIEGVAAKIKDGKTNYFQRDKIGLTPPANLRYADNKLLWDTAFAGDNSLSHYQILVNGEKKGKVQHAPQILKSKPFVFEVELQENDKVSVVTVDINGDMAQAILA